MLFNSLFIVQKKNCKYESAVPNVQSKLGGKSSWMCYFIRLNQVVCFGPLWCIQSIWVNFGPLCPIQSTSIHYVQFGPFNLFWSTQVNFGLFGPFRAMSVHFNPTRSSSVHFGLIWSTDISFLFLHGHKQIKIHHYLMIQIC